MISEFFKDTTNGLLYVFSQDQNREEIRSKTFNRWYLKSSASSHVIKIDKILAFKHLDETQRLYASLLFHVENPKKSKLIVTFNRLATAIEEEK